MTGGFSLTAATTANARRAAVAAMLVAVCLAVTAALGGIEAASASPPIPPAALGDSMARTLVVQEAKLQLAAQGRLRLVEEVTASQVLLAEVERFTDGWLVRATLPIAHWPPYLLYRVGDEYRPLGGFASPDLRELRLEACEAIGDNVSRGVRCGRELARLLDPHGAALVAFRTGDVVRDLNERILRRRWELEPGSKQVAPDTMLRTSDDHVLIRVLAISERAHHVFAGDLPLEYAFVVRADGAVVRWIRVVGVAF